MQFTQQEEKLIRRLRKQDRQWKTWQRWIFLGVGTLMLVMAGLSAAALSYLLNRYVNDPDPTSVLIIAAVLPKIFIDLGIGGALLVVAWRDWHGNVTRMLSLKLLDAQEKRDVDEAAARQTSGSNLPTKSE